jgi:hypothetical protein
MIVPDFLIQGDSMTAFDGWLLIAFTIVGIVAMFGVYLAIEMGWWK